MLWLRSGRLVDPLNIDFGKVELYDVAWALANENRWGGHCSPPISVAQHAIACARAVWEQPALSLLALHHDDGEAFFKDMPRDLKARPEMAWYREQEHACTERCIRHFAPSVASLLTIPNIRHSLKTIDLGSLLTERTDRFPPEREDCGYTPDVPPLPRDVYPRGRPTAIAAVFCGMHRVLTRRVRASLEIGRVPGFGPYRAAVG